MHQMTCWCRHISNSSSTPYLYNLFISYAVLNNSLSITDVHDLLCLIPKFLFKSHRFPFWTMASELHLPLTGNWLYCLKFSPRLNLPEHLDKRSFVWQCINQQLCIKKTSICKQVFGNILAYALGIRTIVKLMYLQIHYRNKILKRNTTKIALQIRENISKSIDLSSRKSSILGFSSFTEGRTIT